jgi:hypothetical protein
LVRSHPRPEVFGGWVLLVGFGHGSTVMDVRAASVSGSTLNFTCESQEFLRGNQGAP